MDQPAKRILTRTDSRESGIGTVTAVDQTRPQHDVESAVATTATAGSIHDDLTIGLFIVDEGKDRVSGTGVIPWADPV